MTSRGRIVGPVVSAVAPIPPAGHGDGRGRRRARRSAGAASTSWPRSTARRCSSTTRRTSAPGAARRSRRSAPAGRSTPRRPSCAGRWPGWPTRRACSSTSPAAVSCTSRSRPACPPTACTLHGNNKSVDELRTAIEAGVRHIVVDSFDELDRLDALHAAGAGPVPDVLLRITPGVHAHTHEYIATGQDDSKFGFNLAQRRRRARPSTGRRRSSSVAPRRAALPHRLQRLRRRELRAGRRGDGRLRRGRSTCPSSSSAAGSAWRTSRARRRRRSPSGPRSCSTRAGALDVRVGGQRRAGPGDRRRGGRHALHGRHDQARSPACARTSPSTAG